ncbi:ABC transporter permease [Actinopolymorpha alba]|uniref:ABC transporter permease n=1 Tax=Actinopolymorpha alba TaxID=533267 RepID=UPI00035E1811|nr:ABC transporter permease [Actinopolymorpha alba]
MNAFRDAGLVFSRAMKISLRNPAWVVIGLLQPILYLALFGPLLQRVASTPGFPPGDAWQVFVPGLLVQLGLFGAAFVGFGLIAEYRSGVIERMRVTPMSRFALLLGRVLRDVVVLVVQALVLVITAVAFGLRAPLDGILIGLLLVGVLGITMASVSYATALVLKSEDAFAPLLNTFMLPVMLLSGIMLPMSLAPGWLYNLSRVNPFSYVVDGARAAFRGDFAAGAFLAGSVVAAVLAVVGVTLGTRVFRRETS